MKLYKTLKHKNVVNLKEIVTGRCDGDKSTHSMYMVFEHMHGDLVKHLNTRQEVLRMARVKNMTR